MLKKIYKNKIRMKNFAVIIVFILIFTQTPIFSKDNGKVSRIEIKLDGDFTAEHLLYYGLDIESAKFDANSCVLLADEYDLKLLNNHSVEYRILSADVALEFQKKYYKWLTSKKNRDFLLQNDFDFGSMAGYYTLEEIYAQFDSMKIWYPEFTIETDTIGYTYEKRPLIVYKFGDSSEKSPQVLITALHHAREPGGAMVIIYFLKDLLKRADNHDPEALYLLNNRTVFVMPVVNPDGYYFNQVTKPTGGGMWRKNRVLNSDSTYGVDLNRNYGPFEFWDAPVNGSSEKPSGSTYRGVAPFSEKETQAIRDFVLSKNIKLTLNYHTYGNLILYPYSALVKNTPDSLFFYEIAEEFSRGNRYVYGRDQETVRYTGRGVADDWFYWTDNKKPVKTFSLTPEVGTVADNFWATPDRIVQQCVENLYMNYQLLWSADINWRPRKILLTKTNDINSIKCELVNTGITDNSEKPHLSLKSLNAEYKISRFPIHDSIAGKKYFALFSYTINSGATNGDTVRIEVSVEHNNFVQQDTFTVYFHKSDTIPLFVNEKLFLVWDSGKWDGEYDKTRERFVLSDSPKGYYPDNDSNYLTLITPVDLDYNAAYLQFDSYWDIETNYDYGVVEISTDNGQTWEKADTRKMSYGSGAKDARIKLNETGFTGFSHRWFENYIPLNKYLNKSIILRFGLLSDKASNRPGWLLDNIRIFTYSDLPTNVEEMSLAQVNVFPNPAEVNDDITLITPESKRIKEITITDLTGNIVKSFSATEWNELKLHLEQRGVFMLEVGYYDGSCDYVKLLVE